MRLVRFSAVALLAGMTALPALGQVGGRAGRKGAGLPASQANLAAAQEKLNTARDKLDTMIKTRQKAFEASPQYAAAKKKVDEALAANRKAKDAVLAKLAGQSAYEAAKARATAAEAAAKNDPSMAQRALDAHGVVGKIEGAALDADEAYKKSADDLKTAQTALQTLKDDEAEKMRIDQKLAAARSEISADEAQVAAWSARVQALKK
jgi:hypothetical protein